MNHPTFDELESALERIRQSPKDRGVLEMIVRRPRTDEREVLQEGTLDLAAGLVGDNWMTQNASAEDGSYIDTQLTLMNSRAIAAISLDKSHWPLAGDQLYVDLDLSEENLPPGSRLLIGTAVVEVTAEPHNGCAKFAARFGTDAVKFVNSPTGKQLHLRGINSKVVRGGTIRIGDLATKMPMATNID